MQFTMRVVGDGFAFAKRISFLLTFQTFAIGALLLILKLLGMTPISWKGVVLLPLETAIWPIFSWGIYLSYRRKARRLASRLQDNADANTPS